MLQVYADESERNGVIVVGGYMAAPDEWKAIAKRWKQVLSDYRVKHFHFREFNSKDRCKETSSPYYGWTPAKRDSFFYALGMSIGPNAVPVGADYFLKKHREEGLMHDPYEVLFSMFFRCISEVTTTHFPQLKGETDSDKILTICDKNPNKHWTKTFQDVLSKTTDLRLDGLSFEDDESSLHIGLQAADYAAAIYCQNTEMKRTTGIQRKPRVIDFIVFRNLGNPLAKGFNFSFMPQPAFELMVEALRQEIGRQKRKWEKLGITDQKYYPLEHVESVKKTADKIAPSKKGDLINWITKQEP